MQEKQFLGFNQIWLNCHNQLSQPLPIDAQIDAIVTKAEYLWLFRGQYFWESAFSFKDINFRVNNALQVSHGILDCHHIWMHLLLMFLLILFISLEFVLLLILV
jgi:hypothetical protein